MDYELQPGLEVSTNRKTGTMTSESNFETNDSGRLERIDEDGRDNATTMSITIIPRGIQALPDGAKLGRYTLDICHIPPVGDTTCQACLSETVAWARRSILETLTQSKTYREFVESAQHTWSLPLLAQEEQQKGHAATVYSILSDSHGLRDGNAPSLRLEDVAGSNTTSCIVWEQHTDSMQRVSRPWIRAPTEYVDVHISQQSSTLSSSSGARMQYVGRKWRGTLRQNDRSRSGSADDTLVRSGISKTPQSRSRKAQSRLLNSFGPGLLTPVASWEVGQDADGKALREDKLEVDGDAENEVDYDPTCTECRSCVGCHPDLFV